MRKLLAACAVAGLALSTAPAAHAHPFFDHRLGCVLVAASDTDPYQVLGGPTVWTGVAAVAVVATRADRVTPAPTAPVFARCDLYVNSGFQGTLVTASGTGVAAGAALATFTALPTDVVDICQEVWVAGEQHSYCAPVTTTQAVPQPVLDIAETLLHALDPLVCPLFAPLAPGLPPYLTVDPATGDVSVLGALAYDCPPYGGSSPKEPLTYLTTTVMTWLPPL